MEKKDYKIYFMAGLLWIFLATPAFCQVKISDKSQVLDTFFLRRECYFSPIAKLGMSHNLVTIKFSVSVDSYKLEEDNKILKFKGGVMPGGYGSNNTLFNDSAIYIINNETDTVIAYCHYNKSEKVKFVTRLENDIFFIIMDGKRLYKLFAMHPGKNIPVLIDSSLYSVRGLSSAEIDNTVTVLLGSFDKIDNGEKQLIQEQSLISYDSESGIKRKIPLPNDKGMYSVLAQNTTNGDYLLYGNIISQKMSGIYQRYKDNWYFIFNTNKVIRCIEPFLVDKQPYAYIFGDSIGFLLRIHSDKEKEGERVQTVTNVNRELKANLFFIPLYPNPTKDEFTFVLNDVIDNEKLVILTDTKGCFYKTVKVSKDNTVKLTDLPKGVYMVKIITNSKVYRSKILKE